MGLSTHVLDTMHGRPAAGMGVALFAVEGGRASGLLRVRLTDDGRPPGGLLLATEAVRAGQYRLVFEAHAYFQSLGVVLPQPPFLDQVTLDFGVADPDQHYHVPLLLSPWSYATYRGS